MLKGSFVSRGSGGLHLIVVFTFVDFTLQIRDVRADGIGGYSAGLRCRGVTGFLG